MFAKVQAIFVRKLTEAKGYLPSSYMVMQTAVISIAILTKVEGYLRRNINGGGHKSSASYC